MITKESIKNGVLNAKISARMEQVFIKKLTDFLPEKSVVFMDGAHNAHGAKAAAEFLKNEFEKDKITNYLINGRTKDTDLSSFLMQFIDCVKCVFCVRVKMEGLPESPHRIANAASSLGFNAFVESSIESSIEKIAKLENNVGEDEIFDKKIHKKPVRILICGSFYLARDLKLIK